MSKNSNKGRAISLSFLNLERGFLTLEALVTITLLIFLLGTLIMSFRNVSTVQHTLEASQNLQIREYTKIYKQIAPSVAETLKIGESVSFVIDSPNYLPTNRIRYVNLFEDYNITDQEWTREGFTEPLKVYNTLHHMANLLITRTDINKYSCSVEVRYYDYKNIQQFRYDLIPERILHVSGEDKATFVRGRELNYEFSFTGEIKELKVKE